MYKHENCYGARATALVLGARAAALCPALIRPFITSTLLYEFCRKLSIELIQTMKSRLSVCLVNKYVQMGES